MRMSSEGATPESDRAPDSALMEAQCRRAKFLLYELDENTSALLNQGMSAIDSEQS